MSRRPDITLNAVHDRRCPLLRYLYDLQEARRAGIHPNEVDLYLDYWWAYDQQVRSRKLREARTRARRAQLDADLTVFFSDYPGEEA